MRQTFDLLDQRGDLMHPNQRNGTGESFNPAGEHKHAGRGANRAASDRSAGTIRTFGRDFRTIGDQGPGHGDREPLVSNEFAHGPCIDDRSARRMDEDRQPAPFEARNRIGEGLRRARYDLPFGRQPFRTIRLAGRVSARDAHEAHRMHRARTCARRRPQVGVRRQSGEARKGHGQGLAGQPEISLAPRRPVLGHFALSPVPSSRDALPYDAALRLSV